jgi:hypothetical protein
MDAEHDEILCSPRDQFGGSALIGFTTSSLRTLADRTVPTTVMRLLLGRLAVGTPDDGKR